MGLCFACGSDFGRLPKMKAELKARAAQDKVGNDSDAKCHVSVAHYAGNGRAVRKLAYGGFPRSVRRA